jgi:hypothetical protein
MVVYGLYQGEIDCSDKVGMALEMVYPQIDSMQAAYEKRVENSELGADEIRKARNEEIWGLAHNEGLKIPAIKKYLDEKYGGNVSTSTLYHCKGWLERKLDVPSFIVQEEIANLQSLAEMPKEEKVANLQSEKIVAEKVAKWQF